jgi:hypothetical protein
VTGAGTRIFSCESPPKARDRATERALLKAIDKRPARPDGKKTVSHRILAAKLRVVPTKIRRHLNRLADEGYFEVEIERDEFKRPITVITPRRADKEARTNSQITASKKNTGSVNLRMSTASRGQLGPGRPRRSDPHELSICEAIRASSTVDEYFAILVRRQETPPATWPGKPRSYASPNKAQWKLGVDERYNHIRRCPVCKSHSKKFTRNNYS